MPNQYTDPNAVPVPPPPFQLFAANLAPFVLRDNTRAKDYPFTRAATAISAMDRIKNNPSAGLPLSSPSAINNYGVSTDTPDLLAV